MPKMMAHFCLRKLEIGTTEAVDFISNHRVGKALLTLAVYDILFEKALTILKMCDLSNDK